MNHKRTIPVNLLIAASLVIAGGIAVYFGTKNFSQVVLLINSPFDQAASISEEDILFDGDDEPTQEPEDDFLPIYVPLDDQEPKMAPGISDTQNSSVDTLRNPGESIPQLIPERVVIEALGVDSLVVPIGEREIEYLGETYRQWNAPRSGELGWHDTSALLGSLGNTVINGHSNGYGDTFKDLANLENGDIIEVYAEDYLFTYAVANVMILKERWEPIEIRMENALWINPSDDTRLTLVSCWPSNSSTHRLIVVAIPLNVTKVDQE